MTRRKLITGFIALAALYILAPVAGVRADTTDTTDTDNNTYTVTDSYTVEIPSSVTVDSEKKTGSLKVSAELEAYRELDISVESQNLYQLKCGDGYGLSYTLTDDSANKVSELTYSTKEDGAEKNFSTRLNAKLADNATAKVSGTYEDILTFKMTCTESYPDGTYKLIYDANGGKVSIAQKILKTGEAYGELPIPTRDGYTFAGWYTEVADGTAVSKDTQMLNNHTTIYAHWTANTYTVKYNNNSSLHIHADGTMDDSVMTYDSRKGLSTCTFSNSDTGAHFVGWNTAADGSGTRYNENDTLNLTSENGAVITLYAQWNYDNIVEVHFEDVDGNMDRDIRQVVNKTLPAGNEISWSIADLAEYKADRTQWEKQWQTPTDNESVNYTTSNESKTTIINIKRQMYYLDLNSQWFNSDGSQPQPTGGGNLRWDGTTTATAEVEVNGEVQPITNEGYDYFVKHRYGSSFKFTVTMKPGYKCIGVAIGDDQPLSQIKWDAASMTVTGIVTGERYSQNSGGKIGPYYATAVALKIQKKAAEDTKTETSSEKQASDKETVNSDSQGVEQDMTQSEDTEPENTDTIAAKEEEDISGNSEVEEKSSDSEEHNTEDSADQIAESESEAEEATDETSQSDIMPEKISETEMMDGTTSEAQG